MAGGIQHKGIVLIPRDFSLDWVARMQDSGLNLLGLHMLQRENDLLPFLESDRGRDAVERAVAAGIDVEYEIHALSLLLPREHFEKHPDWFRMDTRGERIPDGNLCPANGDAMEIVCATARELAARLTPTTHRYYFWPDDGKAWCHCPACQHLSDADQNVVVMNAILSALRDVDPDARLACLAYHTTLSGPAQVEPAAGLFLEWAPIRRCYRHAIDDPECAVNREQLDSLTALLKTFDAAEAQVLEYWMDASMFSRWKRPAAKLPFGAEIMRKDVAHYASLGVRSITSFGCFIDEEYVKLHGDPPIGEYASILSSVDVT